MHKLYELKDMLCEELEEYGSKEKLDVGGLEIVDKLAHAIKNLDKIIEAAEDDEYSQRGSYEGSYEGSYDRGMSRGGSYARGRSNRGASSRRGMSSREGRSYARRYSGARRGGYSRDEEMVAELRELMNEAPDDQTRHEFQQFIQKIESM